MLTWFLTKSLWLSANVKFKTNKLTELERALKSALSRGYTLN